MPTINVSLNAFIHVLHPYNTKNIICMLILLIIIQPMFENNTDDSLRAAVLKEEEMNTESFSKTDEDS